MLIPLIAFNVLYNLLVYNNTYLENYENNTYTKNHIEFNYLVIEMANKSSFVVIMGMLFRRNIPFIRIQWLTPRTLYNCFFIILRTFLLMYCIIEILPFYIKSICLSITLLSDNWWHSAQEPFITNCSYLNAGICWALWTAIFCHVINYFLWILFWVIFTPIMMARMGVILTVKK